METVTPSAFSDCDRARISGSSAAAERTASGTAATAAATMAEVQEEAEVEVVVVVAKVGSESKCTMRSSCAMLEERLDTLFMDMLVLSLGGLRS